MKTKIFYTLDNYFLKTVMTNLVYIENETKVISTDEKGRDNQDTNYLLSTKGHEITHAMDKQEGTFKAGDADQNTYANNFGTDLASYTDAALDYTNDTSMADTNNHAKPKSLEAHLQLQQNNQEFKEVDKQEGDNMPLLIPVGIALIGLSESLNAPEDDTPVTTPLDSAMQAGKDVVQNIREHPENLADGLSNAGVIADMAAGSVLGSKTSNKGTASVLLGTGFVFGAMSEYIKPSSSEDFAHDRQIDAVTSQIKEPYGTAVNIVAKKVMDIDSDDEK